MPLVGWVSNAVRVCDAVLWVLSKLYPVPMLRCGVCCCFVIVVNNASSHCLQVEWNKFRKVCTKFVMHMLVKVFKLHVVYLFS